MRVAVVLQGGTFCVPSPKTSAEAADIVVVITEGVLLASEGRGQAVGPAWLLSGA